MLAGALPMLVSVMLCGVLELPTTWLEKVKVCSDTVTVPPLEPIPDKNNGAAIVLPVTVTVPILAQATVGVKVTLIVQLAFGASELLQLFVCS
jgi:hypothetical protein